LLIVPTPATFKLVKYAIIFIKIAQLGSEVLMNRKRHDRFILHRQIPNFDREIVSRQKISSIVREFYLQDIIDIKPANMEDLAEVITASEFHPTDCSTLVYSSSKGTIRLCDMRDRALCDKHAKRKLALPLFLFKKN
jgi:hypothetical protein